MKKILVESLVLIFLAGCATTYHPSFGFWQQQMSKRKVVAVAETSFFSEAPQRVVISKGKDSSWLEILWGNIVIGHKSSAPEPRYDIF